LNLPLRGGDTLKSAGSRCQGGVQGLLDQGSCTCHRDILLVILDLWGLWLWLGNNWSGFWNRLGLRGDRLGLWNIDWSRLWNVTGSHLY
jgi:hypothetical protein